MIDAVVVRELLEEMDRNTALLEELGTVPRDDFTADPRTYLLAERCFQLAIQCVLDVRYRIAAGNRWPRPQDGAEAILLMGTQGVLPPEFAREIVGMANFRKIAAPVDGTALEDPRRSPTSRPGLCALCAFA